MSKAVLVMDMPKSCMDCKLKSKIHGVQNVTHACNLAEGMINFENGFEEKLHNCPLRELDKLVGNVRCRCYEMGLDESQTEIIIAELN